MTLGYACYTDTIVLTTAADADTDRTVIDKASAVTIDSAYKPLSDLTVPTNSGCAWSAALFIYDDGLEDYVAEASHADGPLLSIDSATGVVTAQMNSAGTPIGSQGA